MESGLLKRSKFASASNHIKAGLPFSTWGVAFLHAPNAMINRLDKSTIVIFLIRSYSKESVILFYSIASLMPSLAYCH
jgi:hypothetical protein